MSKHFGKIISILTILVMCVGVIYSPVTVNAKQLDETADGIEFVSVSDEELKAAVITNLEQNNVERVSGNASEKNTVEKSNETADETVSNTDPNNAYMVENGSVVQGEIKIANEMRWYAFELTVKSKISILLQMVEEMDSDLYMFSYNSSTSKLDLIGGSATEGKGTYEFYNEVLDPGTYFWAVSGYDSFGQYAFAYYQSTDVSNEINDSKESATVVSLGTAITGIIDSPYDIDYYKLSVTEPTLIQYSLSTTNGYSLLYAGKDGDQSAIYPISSTQKSYKLMPGTYYFAVRSESGTYSADSAYTVNFRKVGNLSTDSSVNVIGICNDAGVIYETNTSGTVNYVNGNPIDIRYSYVNNLSNSAGGQYYNITIDANAGAHVLLADEFKPEAVYYHNSTRPAMKVGSKAALMLTYYADKEFYRINCWGTGAYSMNTLRENFKYVTVLIDPSTGKLIDIVSFNYYYDFAPVGTNTITYTRPYKLELFSY